MGNARRVGFFYGLYLEGWGCFSGELGCSNPCICRVWVFSMLPLEDWDVFRLLLEGWGVFIACCC